MRLGRPGLGVCLLTSLAVCPAAVLAQRDVVESPRRVDVLLTSASELSKTARQSMMVEAETIWSQQGVVIEWTSPEVVRPIASNRLRALVVQKRLIASGVADQLTVGELVRPPGEHAVALISIENAEHLVASVRRRPGYELITFDERRLGIVLGRALAHEIGHYLLGTPTHARSGLMRPNFNAREFTDFRDGTFELDHDAAAWLRTRSAEKFAYAHR